MMMIVGVPSARWRCLQTAVSSLLAFALCLWVKEANAQTSVFIMTENVSDYTLQGSGNLPNTLPNVKCFMQAMTTQFVASPSCNNSPSSSSWGVGQMFSDNNVYDTDFVDPNLPDLPNGNDTGNFDQTGNAISYFSGHGFCSGASVPVFCNSSSQCTNPNMAQFEMNPGTCRYGPPGSLCINGTCNTAGQGICAYLTDRAIVTSSTFDVWGHSPKYTSLWSGFAHRIMAFGESAYSGTWDSAGTNGGINLAVLDLSCGVLPPYWVQMTQAAFGGLHFLASIMPVTGDTASVADRGRTFAHRWQANQGEPVMNSWYYTLNDLPQNDGNACVGGNYNLGGGHGINGCGCNIIITYSTTSSNVGTKENENWSYLQEDSVSGGLGDIQGDSWYGAYASCNYDNTTYPFQL